MEYGGLKYFLITFCISLVSVLMFPCSFMILWISLRLAGPRVFHSSYLLKEPTHRVLEVFFFFHCFLLFQFHWFHLWFFKKLFHVIYWVWVGFYFSSCFSKVSPCILKSFIWALLDFLMRTLGHTSLLELLLT